MAGEFARDGDRDDRAPLAAPLERVPALVEAAGALVASVNPGSAAAKAGIKQGDIILKFNGEPVKDSNSLVLKVSQTPPGTTGHLEVFRDGKTLPITATLSEETAAANGTAAEGAAEGGAMSGVKVQTLTPNIASQLNLPPGTFGVVVTTVDPSSPAAGYLQRGDVIQEVNRRPVRNVAEYNAALSGTHNQSVLLLVKRGATTRYVVIQSQ